MAHATCPTSSACSRTFENNSSGVSPSKARRIREAATKRRLYKSLKFVFNPSAPEFQPVTAASTYYDACLSARTDACMVGQLLQQGSMCTARSDGNGIVELMREDRSDGDVIDSTVIPITAEQRCTVRSDGEGTDTVTPSHNWTDVRN